MGRRMRSRMRTTDRGGRGIQAPSRDGRIPCIVMPSTPVRHTLPRPPTTMATPNDAGQQPASSSKKKNLSRAALLVGAAGLFMFIVGVKRRHKLDDEREIGESGGNR